MTCCDCGEDFSARQKNQKRCHKCWQKKKKNGSSTRRSHTPEGRRARRNAGFSERTYWGIDGEGATHPVTGYHTYIYMAACSTTGEIRRLHKNGKPLRTYDILWWLWKIPGHTRFFYSSSYDWTMALRDIEPSILTQIMKSSDPFEPVWWRGFGISYLRGAVTIYREFPTAKGGTRRIGKFFGDLWKCLGCGSFWNALNVWKVGTYAERRLIWDMKLKRSEFSEVTEQVEYYCLLEVRLLAELARKALSAAAERGITPRQWFSAGSAAKHIMRERWTIQAHRGADRYAGAWPELREHIMRAVGGGRFETAETGYHPLLHHYDIASAHPGNMVYLPCLAHGRWVSHYVDGGTNLGMIAWDGDPGLRWGPYPWRTPHGSIGYPSTGQGVYWEPLVRAGQMMPGYDFTELAWWSWVQDCEHQPFARITELYKERLALGKDQQGLMLKVAINAAFGSLADTVSEDSTIASAIWAGLITNGTQSQIVAQLALHGDEIVMIATDGIMCKKPILPMTAMKTLGGWDYKGASEGVFIIQPGLYLADHGVEGDKTRGHGYMDILEHEDQLHEAWDADHWDAEVTYDRRRFIPARLALTRIDYQGSYGQWQAVPCHIKFVPTHRLPGDIDGSIGYSHSGLKVHLYPGCESPLSAPYRKLVDLDIEFERELEDGQP